MTLYGHIMFLGKLLFMQHILTVTRGVLIGGPQFESEWLRITAQSVDAEIYANHGLGAVPGLVEVLVKAIDGPNEGFIFKAIGHGERDDDDLSDMYGGVIYVYNDVSVIVIAPYAFNGMRGSAIYTGDAPYWYGPNSQTSFSADIKVRCWAATSLPEPCINMTNIYMHAGSSNVADTYKDISHNHTDYPSLVKVRVKMADGDRMGWYSDAQGASAFNYNSMAAWYATGGLKFAYNNETIRIWTSSYPAPEGIMFARNDGWGTHKALYGMSRAGHIEVLAWCDLVPSFEQKLPFGPDVTADDMQFSFPLIYTAVGDFFLSALVQAVDGPNAGYLFDVVGSAMPNRVNIGQPCAYGGLIYAHNDTTVRIWRPDNINGAAICISDSMGFGTNSQASQSGQLVFRVFQPASFKMTPEYEPMTFVCSHFQKLGNDTAYNSTPVDTQYNVTMLFSCDSSCRQHDTCVTYAYNNDTCHMYNTTDDTLLFKYDNSQVWGLKARVVNP